MSENTVAIGTFSTLFTQPPQSYKYCTESAYIETGTFGYILFLNSNCLGDSLNRKSIKAKHVHNVEYSQVCTYICNLSDSKIHNFLHCGKCTTYIMRSFAVGKPIAVTKTENPSQEVIDKLHNTYCQALRDLYSEYNPIYGDPSVKLNFIWTELNYVDVVFYWNTYVKYFLVSAVFSPFPQWYWHFQNLHVCYIQREVLCKATYLDICGINCK